MGEVLLVEDWLCSWDGKYQAKLQADGNFVVSEVVSSWMNEQTGEC